MILQARDLRIRYSPQGPPALDGVSCGIAAGEVVAVVGPNGSGKTTLLRGMVGLAPLQSGEVMLEERPLSSWRRGDFARRVGVVSQRGHRWPKSISPPQPCWTIRRGGPAGCG